MTIITMNATASKATKKVAATKINTVEENVDVLGELHEEIKALEAKLKPIKKKYDDLMDKTQELVNGVTAPDGETTYKGTKFICKFGKRANVTHLVEPAVIFDVIGAERASPLVAIPVGALKKATTQDEFEQLSEVIAEGKRRTTFLPTV